MGNAPISPTIVGKREPTDTIYRFYASRPLPVIDGTKSVKHVLLGRSALHLFNRFLHHARGWVTLLYAVGFALSVCVFAVDAQTGAWLAIATLLFQLPACSIAYLVLRYDFVVLIFKTFEFWYAVAVNIVCIVVMWYAFKDWRFAMIITSGVNYEIPFLMDAVHRGTTATIIASAMGAALDVADITLMSFSLMRNVHTVTLYTNSNIHLDAADIVLNGLGTVVVLLIRNAYRKYRVLVEQRKTGSARGSFIMYRCCLELQLVRATQIACSPEAGLTPLEPEPRRLQLFYDQPDKRFDARKIVMSQWCKPVHLTPWSRSMQIGLRLLGAVSQIAMILANHSTALANESPREEVLWVALGGSLLFCGTYFAHIQRDLLVQELCSSFDFMFMAMQFTISHLCGCVMFDWDTHCLLLLSSWLWSMWVITLDAVTPVMRRKLGFDVRVAIVVIAVQLLEQILVIVAILRFDPFNGRDYSLVTIRLGGHTMDVRVVQFLVWRMATCFLWSSRLLWRLFDRKGDELIVLQGRVEYIEPKGRPKAAQKRRTTLEPRGKAARAVTKELSVTPGP